MRGLISIVIVCVGVQSQAQPSSGTISGTVTDSLSGEVLIGAQVLIFRDSGDVPFRSVATNKFGFYSIPKITCGEYRLVARILGYISMTLQLRFDGDTSLHIHLREGTFSFGEVLVEGERTEDVIMEVNSVKVQPGLVKRMPSLGGESDLLRTLQLLPGVKSESEISGGLYIRGSSPDQNLTTLDGMPILNPAHLGGLLSTFNSDALSDIQLIKGAFPAEYGGRMASVLDVSTRTGSRERIGGSAGISLLSSRLTLSGPLSERTTFMVSGRRLYADLLLPMFDPEQKAPRYYFYDVNVKLQSSVSESDLLLVSLYTGRDVLNRSPNNEDANFDVSWGNTASCVRWTRVLSPIAFSNFSLIYSGYHFSTQVQSSPNAGYQDYRATSSLSDIILRGEAQLFLSGLHNLKVGADLARNSLSAEASDRIALQLRSYLPPSLDISADVSGYVQDEWSITPSFSATIGVRLNHMVNGKFTNVEPRVLASYSLSENVRLKGAFAVAHQYLHLVVRNDISFPTDLWVRSGDAIPPALTTQEVLGIESDFFEHYVLSLEGYYKKIKSLLEYRESADFSFGIPSSSNFTSGSGEAYGIELFVEKRVGALTGWIGYTLAWTTRIFPELNGGKRFYPRHDSRHNASLVVNYRLNEKWEFGATWTYATGHPFTLPAGLYYYPPEHLRGEGRYYLDYPERNNYRMPAFHKMDITITHSYSWFGLPFRFFVNVYNVYNHSNPFARYIKFEVLKNPIAEHDTYIPRIEKMTLFPILPTIGLSCSF